MMLRPIHLRMARAALDWSLKDLAERADVNINTLSRYEGGSQVMSDTIRKIEDVLLSHGVIFLEEEGVLGPGVRLKRQLPLSLGDAPPKVVKGDTAKARRKR